MGDIRIGDIWHYYGDKDYFVEQFEVVEDNPVTVRWGGRESYTSFDSPEDFIYSIGKNYRPCEVVRVRNILDRYDV